MRLSVMALCGLTLAAGCARQPDESPEAAKPPAPAPAAEAPAPFFVGRWAARPDLCETGAWTLTREGISTAGEISCRFQGEAAGASPVEVDAVCTADGEQKRWRLRIAHTGSDGALTIEHGPFAPIGLRRCAGAALQEVAPRPPGSPGALPDDRTPLAEGPIAPGSAQDAGQVVQTYFALTESGRSAEGRGLWRDPAAADRFSARYDSWASHHVLIGAPSEVEGAAGSLFVTVPVQGYGRLTSGAEGHEIGEATLRRSNNVPGATDRRWRIESIVLAPAPPL